MEATCNLAVGSERTNAKLQFYHSIAARGEDVEEVLRQAEIDEQAEREAELTSWPKKAKIEKACKGHYH